jgi:protein transport protein SEC24
VQCSPATCLCAEPTLYCCLLLLQPPVLAALLLQTLLLLLTPPPQVVDMGEGGPIRCGRCKAYMNPYVRWASNGKSYTCNFCGCSNQTPDNYFCHIAPDGRRRDAGGLLLQLRLALPVAVLVWPVHVQSQMQATSD